MHARHSYRRRRRRLCRGHAQRGGGRAGPCARGERVPAAQQRGQIRLRHRGPRHGGERRPGSPCLLTIFKYLAPGFALSSHGSAVTLTRANACTGAERVRCDAGRRALEVFHMTSARAARAAQPGSVALHHHHSVPHVPRVPVRVLRGTHANQCPRHGDRPASPRRPRDRSRVARGTKTSPCKPGVYAGESQVVTCMMSSTAAHACCLVCEPW